MIAQCWSAVSGSAVASGAAIEACAAGTTIADLVTATAVSADADACAAGAVSAVVAACTTVDACAAGTAVACTAAVADGAVGAADTVSTVVVVGAGLLAIQLGLPVQLLQLLMPPVQLLRLIRLVLLE